MSAGIEGCWEYFTVVYNDGSESTLKVWDTRLEELWIALAEQFPRDDPTSWIEYVLDADGNEVEY